MPVAPAKRRARKILRELNVSSLLRLRNNTALHHHFTCRSALISAVGSPVTAIGPSMLTRADALALPKYDALPEVAVIVAAGGAP